MGLPFNYLLSHYMEQGGYYEFKPSGIYKTVVYALGVAPLALAYVALFFLLSRTTFGKGVIKILHPVGKMAFTNYILHSVVGMFIFYGSGLGMLGEVGPVYYTTLAFIVFILQIIFSRIWLSYFNYGPIEWLWRSATYGRWQEMVKSQVWHWVRSF